MGDVSLSRMIEEKTDQPKPLGRLIRPTRLVTAPPVEVLSLESSHPDDGVRRGRRWARLIPIVGIGPEDQAQVRLAILARLDLQSATMKACKTQQKGASIQCRTNH